MDSFSQARCDYCGKDFEEEQLTEHGPDLEKFCDYCLPIVQENERINAQEEY